MSSEDYVDFVELWSYVEDRAQNFIKRVEARGRKWQPKVDDIYRDYEKNVEYFSKLSFQGVKASSLDRHKQAAALVAAILSQGKGPFAPTGMDYALLPKFCLLADEIYAVYCAEQLMRQLVLEEPVIGNVEKFNKHFLKKGGFCCPVPTHDDQQYEIHLFKTLKLNRSSYGHELLWLAHVFFFLERVTLVYLSNDIEEYVRCEERQTFELLPH
ncbi:MAG: hypothetical protein HQL56_18760 [Magnetococcales bacterium]|nr:hypothetical protein [Magnetococcales bacterium]